MQKIAWRILAIVVTLVWAFVLISNNLIDLLRDLTVGKFIYNNILYGIPTVLGILLIIMPTKLVFYVIMCCLLGIENIIDGSGTNGLLMYFLGGAFAYKMQLFQRKRIILFIYTILPVLAISSQFRLGADIMVESILDLFFLLLLCVLLLFLFNESFFTKFAKKGNKKLDLGVLKQSELEVLKEVLANKTYSTIGNERNKSESSIKLTMQDVYSKLKLKGKKELMDLYERKMLELPE